VLRLALDGHSHSGPHAVAETAKHEWKHKAQPSPRVPGCWLKGRTLNTTCNRLVIVLNLDSAGVSKALHWRTASSLACSSRHSCLVISSDFAAAVTRSPPATTSPTCIAPQAQSEMVRSRARQQLEGPQARTSKVE
jgi:hypothetical protein